MDRAGLVDRVESLRDDDQGARCATMHVGRHGRSLSEVVADLACGWHRVMDTVVLVGQVVFDDPDRIASTAHRYRSCLTDTRTFDRRTIEEVVAAILWVDDSDWIRSFADRYFSAA